MRKEPIINCHTHIFTGDHVPPFLAKTYVPWPFYYIFHLKAVVLFFRFWYKYPARIPYSLNFKKIIKTVTHIRAFSLRFYPLNILLTYYITIYTLVLLYRLVEPAFPQRESQVAQYIKKAYLFTVPYFPVLGATWVKVLVLLFVLSFFSSIRHLVFLVATLVSKVIATLFGPKTRALAERYLNIGRYAFHRQQATVFSKLKAQYPQDTGFIILPMDMEYMDAGKPNIRYRDQMAELASLKSKNQTGFYPFVFADPRRMVPAQQEINYQPGDKPYFEWDIVDGAIVLKDCFMKDYIETHRFCGIKIYPALGYYPFDAKLLPLWKYCADHGIPVLTHCIRGTIFYRGKKDGDWNKHPVFNQAMGKVSQGEAEDGYRDAEVAEQEKATLYESLVLPQFNNVDFSYNFTHPMNYLCLLEEALLRKVIARAICKDPGTRLGELFGYRGPDQALAHNLRNLKICLGHFGGDDEWRKYFEKDRYNYSSQLAKYPEHGILFFKTIRQEPSPGKPEQIWKYTDWYSIICSMMLQYPQVYADISYILHSDKDIIPLLKQTLQNPGLRARVLFGTDFFVVRNHKSDKNMLADMMGGLSVEDFDQIARINPAVFLQSSFRPTRQQAIS